MRLHRFFVPLLTVVLFAVALLFFPGGLEAAPAEILVTGLAAGMVAKRKADDTVDENLTTEQKKAAGQTASQLAMRDYHAGAFQKSDPITGEPRDLDEGFRVARVDRGETVEDADEPDNEDDK